MLSFFIMAKLYEFTTDVKGLIIKLINVGVCVFFRHMEAVQVLFR